MMVSLGLLRTTLRTTCRAMVGSILVAAGTVVIGQLAHADTLAPSEVYERCYIRLVNRVPKANDPLLKAVQAKTKSASAACLELFDRASFGAANGVLVNRRDPEAKSILKTFHGLHQSWFQNKSRSGLERASFLIRDLEEPALFYTRAVFQPKERFDSVLRLPNGLQGVRDQGVYPNEIFDFASQRLVNYSSTSPLRGSADLILGYIPYEYAVNAQGVARLNAMPTQSFVVPGDQITEQGALVGVKRASQRVVPHLNPLGNSGNMELFAYIKDNYLNADGNRHFGGGVIGSQGFIIYNSNLGRNELASDVDKINRRLTSKIFEDLLCHQMPTLVKDDASKVDDVKSELLPNSRHPFQQQTSCMLCHSTIDGAAFVYRNIFMYRSGRQVDQQTIGLEFDGMTALTPQASAKTFALQNPNGRLHYRENLTGRRVSSTISSIADLGNQLASGNDFYLCAAKRYYKHFTGVDVDLTMKATRPVDLYHQNLVRDLGTTLKTSQRVRPVLQKIFDSDAFKSRNFRTERAVK